MAGHQEETSDCTFSGNFFRYCCSKLARQRGVVAQQDRMRPLLNYCGYIYCLTFLVICLSSEAKHLTCHIYSQAGAMGLELGTGANLTFDVRIELDLINNNKSDRKEDLNMRTKSSQHMCKIVNHSVVLVL